VIQGTHRPLLLSATLILALSFAGCNQDAANEDPNQAPAEPASSITPADIQSVADAALGTGAHVVAFGNLGGTGTQQVLAVNPLHSGAAAANGPDVIISRAVIVDHQADGWKEIFRCDESLKNPAGYLPGLRRPASAGWRLKLVTGGADGSTLYLTPLSQPGTGPQDMIGVRWNPGLKRYESLDSHFRAFLHEEPTLETPEVPIH
jgi:hypothetical protein